MHDDSPCLVCPYDVPELEGKSRVIDRRQMLDLRRIGMISDLRTRPVEHHCAQLFIFRSCPEPGHSHSSILSFLYPSRSAIPTIPGSLSSLARISGRFFHRWGCGG